MSGSRKRVQVGERFGSAVVVKLLGRISHNAYGFECLCDCGQRFKIVGSVRSKSSCAKCGWKRSSKNRVSHGANLEGSELKALYSTFRGIKSRCSNPKHSAYPWYGAKGVRLCAEWLKFENFAAWSLKAGWEKGLTLDRLDEDKNYEPGNCEWVTQSVNAKRARANYHFVKKTDVVCFYDEPCYGDF